MTTISSEDERLVRLPGAMIVPKQALGADNLLAVASLVFFYTYMIVQIWIVIDGGVSYLPTSLSYPELTRTLTIATLGS